MLFLRGLQAKKEAGIQRRGHCASQVIVRYLNLFKTATCRFYNVVCVQIQQTRQLWSF